MCGIAGILRRQCDAEVDANVLAAMNLIQKHRGPDAGGLYREHGVGLAHRRLAIVDLDNGAQPLFNEDGSVVVVYNGEIYNYREIAVELEQLGHQFRSRCDTEVIVHAWEAWGEACLQRFRGMFAFALWDRDKRCLFLARDRLGIKPLYYAQMRNGDIIFSSELKGLMAVPHFPRALDESAIVDYFSLGYVPDPKTIYSGVKKLLPGSYLLITQGGKVPDPEQYWDVRFCESNSLSENDIEQELVELLREAVQMRMVADVPVGAFLSGGVDSSAVVAMMAEGRGREPVNTCCIAFGEARYDESRYAHEVATRYRTKHHVDKVEGNWLELFNFLPSIYDEPFSDSSSLPTFKVCELARKRVKVALSGDGGDESFAGYRRYQWYKNEEDKRQLLPLHVRQQIFGVLSRVYPASRMLPRWLKAKSLLRALAMDSIEGYYDIISETKEELKPRLFSSRFIGRLDGYSSIELLRHYGYQAETDDPISRIQYIDMKTYLPGDILTKVDRASMAHGLEVRGPLLDHKLIEWAAKVPSHLKLANGEGKYIFKKALERYLPADVLYRQKQGFSVPLAQWLRGPLRSILQDILNDDEIFDLGIFDRRGLELLVNDHVRGVRDHSSTLWAFLMWRGFIHHVHGSIGR